MKYFFFILNLVIYNFNAQNLPKEFNAKVIGISDGDTFKVLYRKQEIKIRLNHIDAPERGQDFGKKSKEYASDLAFGKTAKIVWKQKDRYQRIIGEVFIGNKNINQEMVKAGLDWHYKKYSKNKTYEILENQARKEKKGLWQHKSPTPPWEWRNRKKTLKTKNRA